nr:hypothetical protein [Tanacetum cinerariifolium]
MGHLMNRLGIRHTLLFDSTPLHRFAPEAIFVFHDGDLFDPVLETDPCAFDGFVDPLFESEDHVSKGREELGRECSCKVLRGVDDLVLVLLEEDASSSKRFLPAIARDSL